MKIFGEIVKGFKSSDGQYMEVFKNPTDKEVEYAASESMYHCVRGVIQDDGTIYIWSGDILHKLIHNYCSEIDVNSFRFACENRTQWVIDLHKRWTMEEGKELIEQHKNQLSQFGDINQKFEMYFSSDSPAGYDEYYVNVASKSRLRKVQAMRNRRRNL